MRHYLDSSKPEHGPLRATWCNKNLSAAQVTMIRRLVQCETCRQLAGIK